MNKPREDLFNRYEKKDFIYYGFTKNWWSREKFNYNTKFI